MKKALSLILCLLIASAFTVPVFAENEEQCPLYIDGQATGLCTELFLDQTEYVSLGAFCALMGTDGIEWDADSQTAIIDYDGYEIIVACGERYIVANGRYLYAANGVMIKNDRLIVPAGVIAKAMGFDATFDEHDGSIYLSKGERLQSGDEFYVEADLYWLSRIIFAESGAESMNAKLAVGAVVMHRTQNDMFPDTVKGVIFDSKYGVQFTPTANGAIYNTPSESCVIAAKLCLDGADIVPGALYFAAAGRACWASRNRQTALIIGKQQFYY